MEILEQPLINIAPLAEVTFSSKSPWSTPDDAREIVTAEHDRGFSFHTELEDSPYILVDLKRNYVVSHIKVFNRSDCCKDRAKSLRIEYSNDKDEYNILLDINEDWGNVIELSVENLDVRFLRLSLKEKSYFHLRKIEIFANLERLVQRYVDDEKGILKICNLIYKEFNGKFIVSFYDNNFNHIIVSDKGNTEGYYRFSIIFVDEEIFFNIELITKHYTDPDFSCFITIKAAQYGYKIKSLESGGGIYLVKSITKNELIDNIKEADILLEMIYPFLYVINNRKVNNKNKYNNDKSNIIIIDSDLVNSAGFADRLRGILSIINICNMINVNFFIKFNEPFELNKYYKFKEYNSIKSTEPEECNHCSITLATWKLKNIPMKFFELEEVLLFSLKFYNTLSVGTNLCFLPYIYKSTFQNFFKETELLEEKLSHYRKIINGEYISISLRFLNALGDDYEVSRKDTLADDCKINLINICKQEIIKFKETIDRKYKIVVLSDSSIFLNSIIDIQDIYVFPENIMHIGNTNVNEDNFIKTIIDFNIIMGSSHIYRFKTTHLYATNFPWLAAMCSGKPFTHHEF